MSTPSDICDHCGILLTGCKKCKRKFCFNCHQGTCPNCTWNEMKGRYVPQIPSTYTERIAAAWGVPEHIKELAIVLLDSTVVSRSQVLFQIEQIADGTAQLAAWEYEMKASAQDHAAVSKLACVKAIRKYLEFTNRKTDEDTLLALKKFVEDDILS